VTQTILTTQTPGLPNETADLIARTFGYEWQSTVNGTITGGRYYGPQTNQPATVKLKLFRLSDQVLLAGKVFTSTVTGWNTINFDTPVAYVANTTLVICYYMSGDGRYAVTANGLTADIVNGNLKALGNRGRHKTGGAVDDFPVSLNSDLFFVDVNFEPATIAAFGRTAGLAITTARPGNARPTTARCHAAARSLHRRRVSPSGGTAAPANTGTLQRPYTGTVVWP